MTKAMDYFDLARRPRLARARRSPDVQARFLVLSFTSDWLFPPYQPKEIVAALRATRKQVSYAEIESPYGHDAFLLEPEKMEGIIGAFLSSGARHVRAAQTARGMSGNATARRSARCLRAA